MVNSDRPFQNPGSASVEDESTLSFAKHSYKAAHRFINGTVEHVHVRPSHVCLLFLYILTPCMSCYYMSF